MTSEVVVANRLAIALAADSAITIASVDYDDPNGELVNKIFSNADKLFELVRGEPVGVMIYGSADIVAAPWETLIKWYRRERLGKPPAGELADYVSEFIGFVEERFDQVFPKSDLILQLQEFTTSVCLSILDEAEKSYEESIAELDDKPSAPVRLRRSALDAILDSNEEQLLNVENSDWATDLNGEQLMREYGGSQILDATPCEFGEYRISRRRRERMRSIALQTILTSEDIEPHSGLVFAGFGANELFPSSFSFLIPGALCGQLMVLKPSARRITSENRSFIEAFAQTDDANTFLSGIAPELRGFIQSYWRGWLNTLPRSIVRMVRRELDGIDAEVARSLIRTVGDYGTTSWNRFARRMNERHKTDHVGPIEQSVVFLSKAELASLAENLVNLASIRAKVALNREETVGGATDVAVISKGDGFIWVKRKHYFSPELNPTWARRSQPSGIYFKDGGPSFVISREDDNVQDA